MCEIGLSELMTVTHLNKQIPALLLWQSSSTLPAGLEARVFVPQFSDLALLSVTVLRPRLLRLTLASLRVCHVAPEGTAPQTVCVGVRTDASGVLCVAIGPVHFH